MQFSEYEVITTPFLVAAERGVVDAADATTAAKSDDPTGLQVGLDHDYQVQIFSKLL